MRPSEYLKLKLSSDYELAKSLDKGIKGTAIGARKTIDDIYHGAERASWYTSCFFDRYSDICEQLKAEDIRMLMAIKVLFQRKDVIFSMFEAYIKYILKKGRPTRAQNIVRTSTGIYTEYLVGRTTKEAISYGIAKTLSESLKITHNARVFLDSKGYWALTALQYYGKNQKAAMAARRLYFLDPAYYHILYRMNVEMLYIFIEPIMAKVIKKVNKTPSLSENEIIKILRSS